MDVKVTANESPDGSIDWDIDGKKPHQSSIHFAKDSGPQDVKFKLFDRSSRGLRFDTSDPFWSHKHETDCPPRSAMSDQTGVLDCNERQLTVSNKNSGDPCTIHYQLNFVDGQGAHEGVDPEFKNGGGGGGDV